MNRNIFAICGPDGSGKTVLTENIGIMDYNVIYCGKKSNTNLLLTRLLNTMYIYLKKHRPSIMSELFLYFLLYPVEYFDYLIKLISAKKHYKTIIYERYIVDRMWRKFYKGRRRKLFKVLDNIIFIIYWLFFPKIEGYVFLIPESNVLYSRRADEYKSIEDCKNVRNAYLDLSEKMKKKYNIIVIQEACSVTNMRNKVLDFIGEGVPE